MTIAVAVFAASLGALGAITAGICANSNYSRYECYTGVVVSILYGILGHVSGIVTRAATTAEVAPGVFATVHVGNSHTFHFVPPNLADVLVGDAASSLKAVVPPEYEHYGFLRLHESNSWYIGTKKRESNNSIRYRAFRLKFTDTRTSQSNVQGLDKRTDCDPYSCYYSANQDGVYANYLMYEDNNHDLYYELDDSNSIEGLAHDAVYNAGMNEPGSYCMNLKKWQDDYSHSGGGVIGLGTEYDADNARYDEAGACNGQSNYWDSQGATDGGYVGKK